MNREAVETASLVLVKARSFDGRIVVDDEQTIMAWSETLTRHPAITRDQWLEAVSRHYDSSTERIMPAHLVSLAKSAHQEAEAQQDVARRREPRRVDSGEPAPAHQSFVETGALDVPCPSCGAPANSYCHGGSRKVPCFKRLKASVPEQRMDAPAPHFPKHHGSASVDSCTMCDDQGWMLDEDDWYGWVIPCQHRPDQLLQQKPGHIPPDQRALVTPEQRRVRWSEALKGQNVT